MASAAGEPPLLMDTDIIRIAQNLRRHQQTSSSPLPPQLSSPRFHSTIVSHLRLRATGSPNASLAVSDYTLSLLSLISLSPQSPSLSPLLATLLLSYIDLFVSCRFPHDANSLKTIQLFGTLLNVLEINDVQSVVESILSNIPKLVTLDDAHLLDLLPRCIDLIRSSNEVEQGGDFVNSAIDRVVDSVWSKGLLLKLVSLAREFVFLDTEKGMEFLEKVFEGMGELDLQDLPSLVYHLLVLASKGFCKREVVAGLVTFFWVGNGVEEGGVDI